MNTTIRKTAAASNSDTVVIITANAAKFNTSLFSRTEVDFVKSEIKKKTKLIPVNQYNRIVFLHVIDAQKGESHALLEKFRSAGNNLVSLMNKNKIKTATLTGDIAAEQMLAYTEGVVLGNYQFLKYKSTKEENTFANIHLVSNKVTQAHIDEMSVICESVCMARDLVNEPVNTLNAPALADAFRKMGRKAGFNVKVFDKSQIKTLKMGGLLAVNKGSIDPPTFTVMEYKPRNAVNKKPFVLVGKGVVYDTGGLSLKPTPGSMDYMKSDMAGAAAVGCVMHAVASRKLPVHVVALVPATDNRPDGNAYTPGDVITMMSGLTVEVLNTDAEGRMILADALHYAKRYKPQLVMEFSTLTGAAANAIGHYGIVAMGNCNDKVKKDLNRSADHVYERLVEFPFWDEYDELLKSDIADMKNIGGPIAGAITAGRFLNKFVDYPYMHFDIAGPSFTKVSDSYRGKNGSGTGVRFMYDFLKRQAGK